MKTDTNGLDAYFTWAHRKADRLRRYRLIKIAALMGMALLAGCTTAPEPKRVETSPDERIVSPIAAFDFSQCGGALSLYVVVDQTHVMRFDPKQTTIFAAGPDGKVIESSGPPTPFEQALKIAESAGITSNTIAPCDKPGTST